MGPNFLIYDIVKFIATKYPTSSISLNYSEARISKNDQTKEVLVNECMEFFTYEIFGIYDGIDDCSWKVIYDILNIILRYEEVAPFGESDACRDKIYALDALCGGYSPCNTNHMGMIKFMLKYLTEIGILENGNNINKVTTSLLGKILLKLLSYKVSIKK